MVVKRVILTLAITLVVAGGVKEAGAAACCSCSTVDTDAARDDHGSMPANPASEDREAMVGNPSEKAKPGTMGPCDVMALGNREATSLHSEPDSAGAATEAPPPAGEESMTMTPYRFPRDRK